MRFREHRGQLADSMETLVTVEDRAELVEHCKKLLEPYSGWVDFWKIRTDELEIKPYMDRPDTRIGWDKTYIVTIPGYGVMGFTDEQS